MMPPATRNPGNGVRARHTGSRLTLLAPLALFACTSTSHPTESLTEALLALPDSSLAMDQAYALELSRSVEGHESRRFLDDGGWPPLEAGHVAAVCQDRVAVAFEGAKAMPAIGSFVVVSDAVGFEADVFVVGVRGHHALGMLGRRRPGAEICCGNSAVAMCAPASVIAAEREGLTGHQGR